MKCPFCGSEETRIVETRREGGGSVLSRRRKCAACEKAFSTTERLNARQTAGGLIVTRRDGTPDSFNLDKIRRDIRQALAAPAGEDEVVDAVVAAAGTLAEKSGDGSSIPIDEIERIVLRELTNNRTIYAVSRIRYALGLRGSATDGGFHQVQDGGGVEKLQTWLAKRSNWPYGEPHPDQVEVEHTRIVRKRPPRADEAWRPEALRASLRIAAKGHDKTTANQLVEDCVAHIERTFENQCLVTTEQIACEVMNFLRKPEPVTYLRYASAAKRFRTAREFWTEIEDLRGNHPAKDKSTDNDGISPES